MQVRYEDDQPDQQQQPALIRFNVVGNTFTSTPESAALLAFVTADRIHRMTRVFYANMFR